MEPFPHNNDKYNVQFLDRTLRGRSKFFIIQVLSSPPTIGDFSKSPKINFLVTIIGQQFETRENTMKITSYGQVCSKRHGWTRNAIISWMNTDYKLTLLEPLQVTLLFQPCINRKTIGSFDLNVLLSSKKYKSQS